MLLDPNDEPETTGRLFKPAHWKSLLSDGKTTGKFSRIGGEAMISGYANQCLQKTVGRGRLVTSKISGAVWMC
jgi:hypothetical protein